jgi:hypothetical protein
MYALVVDAESPIVVVFDPCPIVFRPITISLVLLIPDDLVLLPI